MIQIQELLVLRQRAVADFPTGLLVIWALTVTVYCEPTGTGMVPMHSRAIPVAQEYTEFWY